MSDSRLRHNLTLLRRAAGCGVCAVVKADAYGHGAEATVDAAFLAADPHDAPAALAVATLAEAMAIPVHDVPVMCLRPIELVWNPNGTGELDEAIRRGVWLSLISPEAAGDVARRAERLGVRVDVQVMLDTGMNREGCDAKHFRQTVRAILDRPALRLCGLGTHFTDGELADEPYNDDQVWLFHEQLEQLGDILPPRVVRHVANSGGTLTGHGTGAADGFDLVRCGLALHGIDPREGAPVGLLPTGRLVAPLLAVRDVPAGATVGYNRTWRADRDTRVGLLPLGYADGYRRDLGDRAVVRVPHANGDVMCPIVGRVSMDYVTIDLSAAPFARQGDEVIVIDDDPDSPCSAAALARLCGTIPYELLCGIGNRVVRERVV